MKPVERATTASPDDIWAVLSNGWVYGSWVVGASRVRAVERGWPALGTHVHHSVGAWPVVTDDNTEVTACDPGRRVELRARIRPVGIATVQIEIIPKPDGALVRMGEDLVEGPGHLLPKPLRQAALRIRNVESLHRLALMAERRSSPE